MTISPSDAEKLVERLTDQIEIIRDWIGNRAGERAIDGFETLALQLAQNAEAALSSLAEARETIAVLQSDAENERRHSDNWCAEVQAASDTMRDMIAAAYGAVVARSNARDYHTGACDMQEEICKRLDALQVRYSQRALASPPLSPAPTGRGR